MIPTFCTIFLIEFFIDWVKHAFVMKFNDISEEVFKDYKLRLAYDFIDSRTKEVKTHTFLVKKLFLVISFSFKDYKNSL